MKQSEGFSRLWPSLVTVGAMAVSLAGPRLGDADAAARTAYTVWTGVGAVGAFVVGIAVLGEELSAMRVLAAGLIVSGLVLMKLSSAA